MRAIHPNIGIIAIITPINHNAIPTIKTTIYHIIRSTKPICDI